jgi:hypothetical protein
VAGAVSALAALLVVAVVGVTGVVGVGVAGDQSVEEKKRGSFENWQLELVNFAEDYF